MREEKKQEEVKKRGLVGGMIIVKRKEEYVFVSGDWHVPYEDNGCVETFFGLVEEVRPVGQVFNGDMNDFYPLSRFDKSPERIELLQWELDKNREYMKRVKEGMRKDGWVKYHGGNHDDRLRKWINKHPEIASLRALELENLLGLRELGFEYVPYSKTMRVGRYTIHHGSKVRSQSGYTARANVEDYGMNIITNHTHRLGTYYRRYGGQVVEGRENGCMCKLDPEYVIGAEPNWQQGFGVIILSDGESRYEEVRIEGGRLRWRDVSIEYVGSGSSIGESSQVVLMETQSLETVLIEPVQTSTKKEKTETMIEVKGGYVWMKPETGEEEQEENAIDITLENLEGFSNEQARRKRCGSSEDEEECREEYEEQKRAETESTGEESREGFSGGGGGGKGSKNRTGKYKGGERWTSQKRDASGRWSSESKKK
jgi:hypothetical protein